MQLKPVRVRLLILFGGLFGYLIFWFMVIAPLLSNKLPGWVLVLVWVLGGGLIGNGIVTYFKKHPPQQKS
jgi:hypothetical protein